MNPLSIRLGLLSALVSAAALLSRPLAGSLSWRSALPESIRETVKELGPDALISGSFDGSEVLYAVHPPSDRRIQVTVESGSFDPMLVVYVADPAEEIPELDLIGQDDDSGEGNSPLLRFCARSDRVYVVGVRRYGQGARQYEMPFTLRTQSAADECGSFVGRSGPRVRTSR